MLIPSADSVPQGEDLSRERMGGGSAEAHLLRKVAVGFVSCIHPNVTLHTGKILQDQNTIQSYSIEEKGFIVCMISKV